jgi:hypothetical protein
MATLYLTEYQGVAQVHGGMAAPQEPALVGQTLAIGGGAVSSVFQPSTKLIRVHVDAICSIKIGPNGTTTAATTDQRFASNQTEYKGVLPGQVLSVISNV